MRRIGRGHQGLALKCVVALIACCHVVFSNGHAETAGLHLPFKFRPPFDFSKMEHQMHHLGATMIADDVLVGKALLNREKELELAGEVFIKAASIVHPMTPQDRRARKLGCCGLRNLAQHPDNQVPMFNDKKAGFALFNCASLPTDITNCTADDQNAITCGLEAYAFLAESEQNQRPMWENMKIRSIITQRAVKPHDWYTTRAAALRAMQSMAQDSFVAKQMWRFEQNSPQPIILAGALETDAEATQVIVNAFMTLRELAKVPCLRWPIWKDPQVQQALWQVVDPTLEVSNTEAGASALAFLAVLVLPVEDPEGLKPLDDRVARQLWGIGGGMVLGRQQSNLKNLKVMIMAYAAPGKSVSATSLSKAVPGASPAVVKKAAAANRAIPVESCTEITRRTLELYDGLALSPAVAESMWTDSPDDVEALVAWANVPGCDMCRQWGLDSLKNIASHQSLRADVVASTGGTPDPVTAFSDAANPDRSISQTEESQNCTQWGRESVNFLGLLGLWELAGGEPATKMALNNTDIVREVIDQNALSGLSIPSMVRSAAWGGFWRLSICNGTLPYCTITSETWANTTLRTRVIAAAIRLTSVGNILIRQFAVGVMYEWSNPVLMLYWPMYNTLRLRTVVLDLAVQTDEMMRTMQQLALGIIYNWARNIGLDGQTMRQILWQDVRDVLFEVAINENPALAESRALAMCTLQELATVRSNAETMYNDATLVEILEAGMMDWSNRKSQECAFNTVAWLAKVEETSINIWATNGTREILLYHAGKCNPFRTRTQQLAMQALAVLAYANGEAMWFSRASFIAIRLAGPKTLLPTEGDVRTDALAMLYSMALSVPYRMFFDKFGVMRVLATAAKSTSQRPSDQEAKRWAYLTYGRLAETESIRLLMWYNPFIRKILLSGASPPNNYAIRASALKVLWQLSFSEQLKRAMWQTSRLRCAIIAGVQEPAASKVQLFSLYIVRNLAQDPVNAIEMWKNADLVDAMRSRLVLAPLPSTMDCTSPPDQYLQAAFILAAFQEMAYSYANQVGMWNDDVLKDNVLDISMIQCRPCAATQPMSRLNFAACFHARQYALAMNLLFSRAKVNREDMYSDSAVTESILKTCTAQWTEDLPEGRIARAFVMEELQFLASLPSVADDLFENKDTTQSLLTKCVLPNAQLPPEMPSGAWSRVDAGDDGVQTLVPRAFINLQEISEEETELIDAGIIVAALSILAEVAAVKENQGDIWEEFTTGDDFFSINIPLLLLRACAPRDELIHDPSFAAFRAVGCRGLAFLAENATNKGPMWAAPEVREAITAAGIEHSQYNSPEALNAMWDCHGVMNLVRMEGMRGLANLAEENKTNQASMWMDAAGARFAFELGARIDASNFQEGWTREDACRGFKNLARLVENQSPMWRNKEIRRTIMEAAQNGHFFNKMARSFCMHAMTLISEEADNQATMWHGAEAINTYQRRRRSRRLDDAESEGELTPQAKPTVEDDDGGEAWARLAGFA